uniref:Uncharacterized protein n=1 Tax=Candidatus Methanogaster sp. ANME-2c ERB4 TaxID=2759911 RepID=A0A7G9YN43_9EURY|nr:hypothetical protein JHKIABMC_00033 [Methanosarcinales archaeon ANME-2c ERB4]
MNGLVGWPVTLDLVISGVMAICEGTMNIQSLHSELWFVTCILSEYLRFILDIMKLYSYRSLNIMICTYTECTRLFGDLIY